MRRKKILWLVSWYPNKNDRFDGDFIQRHARAAAIFHDIHVIFVTDADLEEEKKEEWNFATGLTEQVIYFNKKKGIAARIRKQIVWKNICQDAVKKYIDKKGLPDCIHVHIPWKVGLIALWVKKKFGIDFIVSEHWGMYDETFTESFYAKPKITQKLVKEIYGNAKAVVTVSDHLAKEILKFSNKRTDVVIPNVVDTTLFFPGKVKYSKLTFIHVSNMVKLKNVESILRAFKNVVDTFGEAAQLILIGNKHDEYVNTATELGVLNDSVFFRGEINYFEVAEEMRRSHCLVLFSDSETFSCVTAEALCCGLPIVSSRVGALPELVNDSNGMLVPIKNREDLSIAMVDMMERYQSYNQINISEEASKKFSYSTIAEKFNKLYNSFC